MRELFSSETYRFIAVGDRQDPAGSGIRSWDEMPPGRFVPTRCTQLWGPIMLQGGLLRLSLRRDLSGIVFTGMPHLPITWIAALLARMTGKRVLFWTHGWRRRDRGLKRLIRRAFYRIPHGLLLYGHGAKMIGLAEGFRAENLYVIYNSLDYEAQRAARTRITLEGTNTVRTELFPGSERPMAICVSRLTELRRLDLMLAAMAIQRDQGRPIDLLLVGEGGERANLERVASDEGLSVHFYGACYDENRLAELIGAANVTVSPGAIGLTAMHSMAYGTPVITHDDPFDQGPEFEAIIPGKTGASFRRGDVEDLAQVVGQFTRERWPDDNVRRDCHEMIERLWNPRQQRRVIEHALSGAPADDLLVGRHPTRSSSSASVHHPRTLEDQPCPSPFR